MKASKLASFVTLMKITCPLEICSSPCAHNPGQLSDSEGIVNSLSGPYKLLNSQPSDSGAFYSVVVQGKKM